MKHKKTEGWGVVSKGGVEIWDTDPVFKSGNFRFIGRFKLIFFPKRFALYRYIRKAMKKRKSQITANKPFRILDVGCGTGSAVIDFKKMFGRSAEVIGIDVVKIQVELAREKMRKFGVWAVVEEYDGENIPYPADYFDAVYTSDVFGHVNNLPRLLNEISRVLKAGGVLAVFTESLPGKHAYLTNYFLEHGLNTDPHSQFHISLYSKKKLRALVSKAGFDIKKMRSIFWLSFIFLPDEYYGKLSKSANFPFLRTANALLYYLKKTTHPVSTAVCELYGLVEMYAIGRWIEGQGYIILAKKRD